jgi:hypothetical protein
MGQQGGGTGNGREEEEEEEGHQEKVQESYSRGRLSKKCRVRPECDISQKRGTVSFLFSDIFSLFTAQYADMVFKSLWGLKAMKPSSIKVFCKGLLLTYFQF